MATALAGLVFILSSGAGSSRADEKFPKPGWKDEPVELASEFAEPGGKHIVYSAQYPKSFNYYLDYSVTARRVFMKLYDTLLNQVINRTHLREEPLIASEWVISDDKKTFTFKLNPAAKWSDGKPIIADDVVWTFYAIKDPKNLTGPFKVMLSRIEKAEKLDERTVRFTASEVHWSNLQYVGSLFVLPKHWAEKQKDFNDINFEFPVVSGPYAVSELREPEYIRIKRRDDYWNRDAPSMEGIDNFDIVEHRYYREREQAFDHFRKGEIDLFAVYTSNRWVNETKGERFDKNWIVKQAVYNYNPVGFQGLVMNMRRELFKDKRVRRALAHLQDRKRMNATIMHNQYTLATSYYQDLWTPANPCPNKLIEFDKEKARALFKEAGWAINPGTGKLEKDGKPFKFTILERNPAFVKFHLIYKEALNELGIDVEIQTTDWSSWSKAMDSYEFDMSSAAWAAVPLRDPEPMWHSKYADLKANNNYAGLKNPKADALIEKTITEFDVEKRNAILRELDQILYDETPYILAWYIDYVRLLYWNKFGVPDQVLSKYEDEESTVPLWWHDPDAEADLEAAMKSGNALPPVDYKVDYNTIFPPTAEQTEALK